MAILKPAGGATTMLLHLLLLAAAATTWPAVSGEEVTRRGFPIRHVNGTAQVVEECWRPLSRVGGCIDSIFNVLLTTGFTGNVPMGLQCCQVYRALKSECHTTMFPSLPGIDFSQNILLWTKCTIVVLRSKRHSLPPAPSA